MNKKIVLALVAFLAVVGIFLGIYYVNQNKQNQPKQEDTSIQDQDPDQQETPKTKSFTVVVVHKDETSKEFTYEFTEEQTILGQILQSQELISGEEGPYGMYIKVVDGESAVYETDGAYWAFYVGENYATAGIDKTTVTDGAVYKLVYTVG